MIASRERFPPARLERGDRLLGSPAEPEIGGRRSKGADALMRPAPRTMPVPDDAGSLRRPKCPRNQDQRLGQEKGGASPQSSQRARLSNRKRWKGAVCRNVVLVLDRDLASPLRKPPPAGSFHVCASAYRPAEYRMRCDVRMGPLATFDVTRIYGVVNDPVGIANV